MMKRIMLMSIVLLAFEPRISVDAHTLMTGRPLKHSKTFLRKHTRELLALAAGAAIAGGATAYGMKKQEGRKIAALNQAHEQSLAAAEERYNQALDVKWTEYQKGMKHNESFFKKQLAEIKATLEDTIQRTVTVALETFKGSLDAFQDRIDDMLTQQAQEIRQGVDDFKSAGRQQQEASTQMWQQQFDALGDRFSTMFDAHAKKLAADYAQLQTELVRKEQAAEARDLEHKEQIRAQLAEQQTVLRQSLQDALRILDTHKSQMTDLVMKSQELVVTATDAQRHELLKGLQEIGAAGQRFEASQAHGMANIHALLTQHSQQLLGTIDSGMAQGFMQQNQALTNGLVTGFTIQQQQVGQLLSSGGGMPAVSAPAQILDQRQPLLLEDAPEASPFSPEAQGRVQGPLQPRSQEELAALDPAPSLRQQSGPGSVVSVRSRSSQKSSASVRSQEQPASAAREYVLSRAAQERIAMGRAQRILQKPEFQQQVPQQIRSGGSGVRASRGNQMALQPGVMVH